MKNKAITLVLSALLLHASGALPLFACAAEYQSPDATKEEVAKAYANKYTVEVTPPDHKKLKGKVTDYTDEAFVLRDKSGADTSLAYSQVRVTRHHGLGTKILIGVGLGAGAAAGLLLCGTGACN